MAPSAELLADLRRDEGLRLRAYPDPLSGGPPWTIGYGHTGPEVHAGLEWTRDEAEAVLRADAEAHVREVLAALPWVARLGPARRDVLFNMAFNLGVQGLLGFRNTLARIERGDYAGAASGMLKSLWARQVGQRAQRLAFMMRTGARI